jgi:hypothetical protein
MQGYSEVLQLMNFRGISSADLLVKKNITEKSQFRLLAQKASGNHKAGSSNELSY